MNQNTSNKYWMIDYNFSLRKVIYNNFEIDSPLIDYMVISECVETVTKQHIHIVPLLRCFP